MNDSWKKLATEKLQQTRDMAEEFADRVVQKADESGLTETIQKKASEVKDFLDEKGVTETAGKIAAEVDNQFSVLSGQKILALVEERLTLQATYNDVIADQLEKALQRIAVLEAELVQMKKVA